jgi:hypothetical protein
MFNVYNRVLEFDDGAAVDARLVCGLREVLQVAEERRVLR